jgi:LEA14-like dessication related protein
MHRSLDERTHLNLRRAVGFLITAGLMQGCALFYRAPSVEIVGVEVVALGLTSGTAEVVLDVTNEGGRRLDLQGVGYKIEVKDPRDDAGWDTLAEAFHRQELSIPGRETRRVRIPVPFQYSALGTAVRSFLSEGEVPYRLNGEVWLGGSSVELQIPFRTRGVLKP